MQTYSQGLMNIEALHSNNTMTVIMIKQLSQVVVNMDVSTVGYKITKVKIAQKC